jgi:hypothetical protein
MKSRKPVLIAEEIQKTIQRLCLRIKGHFPDRDLVNVCNDLYVISREAHKTVEWIARPNYVLRLSVYTGILLTALFILYCIRVIHVKMDGINLAEFVQMAGAALDGVVLIGGGIIFLFTLENRRKRERVIHAVNHLRCIAHIIDMHQLPKDLDPIPDIPGPDAQPTQKLTPNELAQYLDYCSEMLSLVSKTGFLYVQHFNDPVATEAVNDLEDLSTGLARKIWQKIMVIRRKTNA